MAPAVCLYGDTVNVVISTPDIRISVLIYGVCVKPVMIYRKFEDTMKSEFNVYMEGIQVHMHSWLSFCSWKTILLKLVRDVDGIQLCTLPLNFKFAEIYRNVMDNI